MVAPADAQKTTFNPSISIGFTYTDNVGYVGADSADSATEDTAASVGVAFIFGMLQLGNPSGWSQLD